MKNTNIVILAFILSMLVGCGGATPSIKREKTVIHQPAYDDSAKLPKALAVKKVSGQIPFYGVLKTAPGDSGHSMMYSGDAGVGGLFAQILVQAAMANEAQNTKLSNAQKASNLVLESYSELIEQVTYERLVQASALVTTVPSISIRWSEEVVGGTDELFVEFTPVFYLSQDEKTILIENHGKAFYGNSPDEIVFENSVTIVTSPVEVNAGVNPWLQKEGEKFFSTIDKLYQSSFDLLLRDMYKLIQTSAKQSTHKYYIGHEKHYVRGSVIEETCASKMLRDLKGNILVLHKDHKPKCNA